VDAAQPSASLRAAGLSECAVIRQGSSCPFKQAGREFAMTVQRPPRQFGGFTTVDEDWLNKRAPEAVLEPDLPIIDTHHHLWERPHSRYLLHEFLADLQSGHNTIATVFLQCHAMYKAHGPVEMRPIGETEFVAGIAAMSDSGNYGPTRIAAGIVGFADLALGDRAEAVLEAQIRAGSGRFRGVRHSAAWDADATIGNAAGVKALGLYNEPSFREGLRRLTRLGLSLDAWVFHPQLDDVIALARAHPDANIILGHIGGVLGYGRYLDKRDEIFPVWKAQMAELAKCPNVSVKLGGVMMRLAAFDYITSPLPPTSEQLAALWSPWMSTCIDLFGANRCMFESNFPVEKMGVSWVTIWNTFKRIAAGASADEKTALFSGTAKRVYRLDV
jgi:predicted TIM-barrel fold metal-dependent hydrolase